MAAWPTPRRARQFSALTRRPIPKSRVLEIVVSVRRARPSLKLVCNGGAAGYTAARRRKGASGACWPARLRRPIEARSAYHPVARHRRAHAVAGRAGLVTDGGRGGSTNTRASAGSSWPESPARPAQRRRRCFRQRWCRTSATRVRSSKRRCDAGPPAPPGRSARRRARWMDWSRPRWSADGPDDSRPAWSHSHPWRSSPYRSTRAR